MKPPQAIECIHAIKITQPTANRLGDCLVPFTHTRDVTYEYITDDGTANPSGLLHPNKRGCGVTRTSWQQLFFRIVRFPLVELLSLGGTELKLYIYLLDLADSQQAKSPQDEDEWYWKPFNLHEVLNISSSTCYRALSRLEELGLMETRKAMMLHGNTLIGTPTGKVEVAREDCWQPSKVEKMIRDRLMSVIGGQPEVSTPVGRIDLLTDTETIEVKYVADWKSAMGQVLAYASFYPYHTKRIHLFGEQGEAPVSVALAICSQQSIVVTFEEVSNG